MSTNTATATADPWADPKTSNSMAIKALIPLLITFMLGALCLQGFNLVFTQVGEDVGATAQASLITALPSIVLGIVCFIYGSLGDFVSLKKLVVVGLITLFVGSIFGFVASFFFTANLWTVIIARVLQTAGEQVAGSAFLVVASKYLKPSLKVVFFGLFTAGYQISASVGVFAAGMLSAIAWQYLFLIPSVTILFLPLLLKNLPDKQGNGEKVDWLGFTIIGFAVAFLTLFFSYNAIGANVYGMTTSQVSTHIVFAFLMSAVFGICSGAIVGKIGVQPSLTIASTLMAIGFIGAGFTVNSGFVVLTLSACVFYAGCGLMYSPVVSTVLGTLSQDESGRGVGMNDLVMDVTGSIGIAIFGGLMSSQTFSGSSIIGATEAAASYSNLLLIAGCVPLIGVIYYLVIRKKIGE